MGSSTKYTYMDEQRKEELAKKRTFANPQDADEKMPSLEQLANGRIHPDSGKWKTKEEILENGTLIEKLRLYFASEDLKGYFGKKESLTEEETAKIAACIKTEEGKKLLQTCDIENHILLTFGRQASYLFRLYQVAFSTLALLLNRWENYEEKANEFTLAICNDKFHSAVTNTNFRADLEKAIIKGILKGAKLDGATLYYNDYTRSFEVKMRKSLYSQIKKEAKSATDSLANFKAYAVVAEKFIEATTLKYMPISIRICIENAEEERYARYLVKYVTWFRSEISSRKEAGITITPNQEKMAIIPDYNELQPSKDVYKDATEFLNELIKNYNRWQG